MQASNSPCSSFLLSFPLPLLASFFPVKLMLMFSLTLSVETCASLLFLATCTSCYLVSVIPPLFWAKVGVRVVVVSARFFFKTQPRSSGRHKTVLYCCLIEPYSRGIYIEANDTCNHPWLWRPPRWVGLLKNTSGIVPHSSTDCQAICAYTTI